ncbi:MAG TPA: DUF805 domain-containing protein [Spirochaetota bacterium]|nr:DUF805 domain-containing protein [Spirochaetota bacterium]
MGWYFEALKKYAVFNGRARRKEYWMFTLFFIVFLFAAAFIDVALGASSDAEGAGILLTLYILAMIIPSISVSVRRLHDLDKNGWLYLINFIPFIGPIWFLVLMCTEGIHGNNIYGADPKITGN